MNNRAAANALWLCCGGGKYLEDKSKRCTIYEIKSSGMT